MCLLCGQQHLRQLIVKLLNDGKPFYCDSTCRDVAPLGNNIVCVCVL